MLQPLNDKVFITPGEPITKAASGLFLAPRKNSQPDRGVIAAVGPGNHTTSGVLIAPEVEVGDFVIYESLAAEPFEVDGKKYVCVEERAIRAVIGKNAEPSAD